MKQSMVYDVETTIHTKKKLLHSPWSTMMKQQLTQEEAATLSVVYDAETTTHTKSVTLSVVYDAKTTTQSCYTDHNNRTLSQN